MTGKSLSGRKAKANSLSLFNMGESWLGTASLRFEPRHESPRNQITGGLARWKVQVSQLQAASARRRLELQSRIWLDCDFANQDVLPSERRTSVMEGRSDCCPAGDASACVQRVSWVWLRNRAQRNRESLPFNSRSPDPQRRRVERQVSARRRAGDRPTGARLGCVLIEIQESRTLAPVLGIGFCVVPLPAVAAREVLRLRSGFRRAA